MRTVLFLALAFFAPQFTTPLHHPYVGSSASSCSSLPFTDTFTRANGPLGSPWTQTTGGTVVIASNAATPGTSGGNELAWPVGCPGWTSSQYAKFTFTSSPSTSTNFGTAVRVVDQNNAYLVNCQGGGLCSFYVYTSGSYANQGTFSGASVVATGDVVCLELDSGSTIKLKINSTYDSVTFSVSALSSGGGGMFFGTPGSSAVTVTNFQTGNGTCP